MSIDRGHGIATSSVLADSYDLDALIADTEAAKVAAQAAQTGAELALDTFDDRYLGAKASDPTVDNDGDALIDGAMFFDTTLNITKIYDLATTTWLRTTPTTAEQAKIDTVSAKAAEIGRLGTADAVADMNVLGTADVVLDMNTLGTADVVTDMNVLGTADVVSDMNTLGTSTNVTNMDTLAGISANVTTVAGISSGVTTVAGQTVEIGRLGTSTAVADMAILATNDVVTDMNTLGTADVVSDMNVLGTADVVTDMNVLATADVVLDMNVLGTATNVTNMDTVAGISSNVTTVAGISANVTSVAGNATNINAVNANSTNINAVNSNSTNINAVAGAATNVNLVGGSITNVNEVGTNIASVNNFANQYRVAATAPTTSLDAGDLWFDTTANIMKVYTGSSWANAGSSVNGIDNSVEHIVTAASQTSFTATYDAGYLNVFLNGVKLDASDYTATDGANVVLDIAATTGASVFIQSFGTFVLADVYTKTAADTLLDTKLPKAGGTMTGDIALGDNVKAKFGAGSDLQIYHNGTDSYLLNSSGQLILRNNSDDKDVIIQTDNGSGGSSNYVFCDGSAGSVSLGHYGAYKLATTSTGIDVTGSVTCDNKVTIDGGTGYGAMEIGGDSGAFIDLKAPHADDYDGRLQYDGGGSGALMLSTSANNSSPVILKQQESEKLRTTSTGINVTGTVTATSFAGDGSSLTGIEGVPSGIISMWSGAAAAIPSGWNLCDGSNSTPNLVGKFIKGSGTAGTTGGSNTHTHAQTLSAGAHTLSTAQMPSHKHNWRYGNNSGSYQGYESNKGGRNSDWYAPKTDSTNAFVANNGGSSSHSHSLSGSITSANNEPEFYTLCYIMKA